LNHLVKTAQFGAVFNKTAQNLVGVILTKKAQIRAVFLKWLKQKRLKNPFFM
jgi:hypothetical protein